MNRLSLISGMAVFVAAIFLIPNTSNTVMAYTCSSTSSTHNLNSQTGVSGSSGSCSSSSSAATGFGTSGFSFGSLSGPNGSVVGQLNFGNPPSTGNFVGSGPGSIGAGIAFTSLNPSHVEATSSSSSGGAQSSCSSSSASGSGGAVSTSTSQSQPGHCP